MVGRRSHFAVGVTVAWLASLAGVSACGGADPPAAPPSCEERDGLICSPPGFAFVKRAIAVSDYCFDATDPTRCPATTVPPAGLTTARLTQPSTGKLCMAGTVAPDGWALLVLTFFDTLAPVKMGGTTSFHPTSAGITALELAVDSPPSGGITPSAYGGFNVQLPTNPGVPLVVTSPGSVILPLMSFVKDGNPPVSLAPDDVQTLGFGIPPGDYDFCIHDFRFLDAAGNAVTDR